MIFLLIYLIPVYLHQFSGFALAVDDVKVVEEQIDFVHRCIYHIAS